MTQTPHWKNFVSAAVHTGVKAAAAFVPGATLVTDFCDRIISAREAESRHDEIVTRIGTIEQAVRTAFSQVCQRMTQPGLTLDQLDAITHDLFEMRQANREPFLSHGMFENCVLYPDVLKNPNRYGRVLDHNATLNIEDDSFYVFLDIDKTRLLKMSHGQTLSLLAGQRNGIPASEVIGRANFFAQRIDTKGTAVSAMAQLASAPRIIVPSGTIAPADERHTNAAELLKEPIGVSVAAHPLAEEATGLKEQLEQFKVGFAKETSASVLQSRLLDAEDLLILVCGQERYASLRKEADDARDREEECEEHVRRFTSRRSREDWQQKMWAAGDDLKRRIASIVYRGK